MYQYIGTQYIGTAKAVLLPQEIGALCNGWVNNINFLRDSFLNPFNPIGEILG
jgi:hypothetical protein